MYKNKERVVISALSRGQHWSVKEVTVEIRSEEQRTILKRAITQDGKLFGGRGLKYNVEGLGEPLRRGDRLDPQPGLSE